MKTDMVHVRRKGGHSFDRVPRADIPRSQFDRSHGVKTTFDADTLYPMFVDEVLPGDTHTCKVTGFVRVFSPLKAPIMDNIRVDVHFFYVPTRLLWTNWEKFNGAQDNPADSTDFTIPKIDNGYTVVVGDLYDYMGIPIGLNTTNEAVNALPGRAYNAIYNEWYRDQNLINSRPDRTATDGPDGYSNFTLQKRAKKRDYFTSCLPWPQKTDTPVSIGLTGTAPVIGLGMENQAFSTSGTYYESDGASRAYGFAEEVTSLAANNLFVEGTAATNAYPAIYADLSAVQGTTINALREAFQVQKLLEKDARGGTRYIEILQTHFGVTNPDYRLQRPEYLGGGSSFINVSPVAQTSEDGTTKQGQLRGVGTGVVSGAGFAKSFTEHGYILGIVSAVADLTYQQGLDRMWSRSTRYDFYWPSLAQLGEQAVLNKELFVNGTSTDDDVFGYQERYAEYRYARNKLTGKFRSDAAGSLDLWHLSEDFSAQPSLNQTFIEYATPMSRIQSVTTEPDFIGDLWFNLKSARPMPVFGVPGLIDHF